MGEEDEPRRLRRLITLSKSDLEKEEGGEMGGVAAQLEPDSSVVKGVESKLEACLHSEVCCDLCSNLMSSPKNRRQKMQKMESSNRRDHLRWQPRSPAFILMGGDVGTAHIREERRGWG